jgi:hypothetical protein
MTFSYHFLPTVYQLPLVLVVAIGMGPGIKMILKNSGTQPGIDPRLVLTL